MKNKAKQKSRWPASSDNTVGVAIIDSPLDYQHADIINVLDSELMKEISYINEDGLEKSWYEINQEAKKNFQKNLDQGKYREQLKFIEALSKLTEPQTLKTYKTSRIFMIKHLKNALKGLVNYTFSSKYRSQIQTIVRYIHGTHVAGIAVNGLKNIRLINIPLVTHESRKGITELLKYDVLKQKEEIERYFASISDALQKANVRVVNLSIGISDEMALKNLEYKANYSSRLFFKDTLKKMAKEAVEIYITELEKLFKKNPNIVFVMAAGNEKIHLDKITKHSAKINQPNVIKVAAVNRAGALASFSNKSSSYIDIAALGTAVRSSLIDGGHLDLSGTSQAAPNVTNALTSIFLEDSQISAQEAISKLYSNLSSNELLLKTGVNGGKFLTQKLKNSQKRPGTYKHYISLEDPNQLSQDRFTELIRDLTLKIKDNLFERTEIEYTVNGRSIAIQTISNQNGQLFNNVELIDKTTPSQVNCNSAIRQISGR